MKLGCCDNFGELFHVGRLDVDNVCKAERWNEINPAKFFFVSRQNKMAASRLTKTLIGDLEMPQVDSQIVGRHERLLIAVE